MDSAGHQRAFLISGGCCYNGLHFPLALMAHMAFECHKVDRHLAVLEPRHFWLSSQGSGSQLQP